MPAERGGAVAGVVLAAGSSSRLGRNKLLLPVGGTTLLRRSVAAALAAALDPVLVVLGHELDRALAELRGLPVRAVPNPEHAAGINTSLRAGIRAVPPDAPAAVVLLADMPFVTPEMVRAVVARHGETGAPIVSSRYEDVAAPPTLYARAVFPELAGGEGEGRGREVVRRRAAEVAWVDWPASALADLDRERDLDEARVRLGEEDA